MTIPFARLGALVLLALGGEGRDDVGGRGASDPAGGEGSAALVTLRTTYVTAEPRDFASLGVRGHRVWAVDGERGRVLAVSGGRPDFLPLRCGAPSGSHPRDVRWSARGAWVVLAADATLWGCDLRTGAHHRVVSLPSWPSVVDGFDGGRVAAVWLSPFFSIAASLVTDGGAAREIGLAATAPDLLRPLPGVPAPSPFVPVTVAGGRLVVGNPETYHLAVFDERGRVVRRFGREGIAPARYTDADRELILSRMPGSPALRASMLPFLQGAKPYFRGTTLAGDRSGRVWIATSLGHPESSELNLFHPSGRMQAIVLRGQVERIAVDGDRLVALSRVHGSRPPRTRITEYAIRWRGAPAGAAKGEVNRWTP